MRYKFIFACTIWTLKEKEISFCNNFFMYDNHYTSGVLVKKIMHLSQIFFYMRALKALAKLNVTYR